MTTITIRQIEGDEMLDIMHGLLTYAFRPSPPLFDKEEWQEFVRGRENVTYYALFEDDTAVASAAGAPMTQQIRGKLYGMGGIWGVVTHPAARRKGYCRQVTTHLLAAIRESGRPFSTLYPFRESFYQRLGYVTFPLPKKALFSSANLTPLLQQELNGRVDQLLSSDHLELYLDYVRQMRVRVHGLGMFDHFSIKDGQRRPNWLAVARVDEEIVGLMAYTLKGDAVTQLKLAALRFYYHRPEGRYLLLDWIARHIDQASEVEMWLAPYEQPETWWADMKVKVETAVRAPMGRVLDVAQIGGMNSGPGRFTARISDPVCPWNEGVWLFETVGGVLQVSPAEMAQCELSIQGLTALVYGTHSPEDFAVRGWGDPSPAQQVMMQSVFSPQIPYLHEMF